MHFQECRVLYGMRAREVAEDGTAVLDFCHPGTVLKKAGRQEVATHFTEQKSKVEGVIS